MTYEETLRYLYSSLPAYERSGATAYKPGLDTSIALDEHLENPHLYYKCIHIAGTNGKGSVSHLLAAILQHAGFRVGLYTSPHLTDFRERIRVNGVKISKTYVTDFVEKNRAFFEPLRPSFFEMTSTMAFDYFRQSKVDYAIIETGLGGRLDSTNIITPILSIITNISMDHTQFLGNTPEQIAFEKAGIIKRLVPVVIGESGRPGVNEVFIRKAKEMGSPLCFASESNVVASASLTDGRWQIQSKDYGMIVDELGGDAQLANARTVLEALRVIGLMESLTFDRTAVTDGFAHVVEETGLRGRWQTVHSHPTVIIDSGHNPGGWKYNGRQLRDLIDSGHTVRMIVGMMADKDIDSVMQLMPQDADYIFTAAATERAMKAEAFAEKAALHGLHGIVTADIQTAVRTAMAEAKPDDVIFIGGSTYVVAEAMPLFEQEEE